MKIKFRLRRVLLILLRATLILFSVLVLGAAILLSVADKNDYQPSAAEPLDITGGGTPLPPAAEEFTLVTWNIGYCGLGADMDFFYDGGSRVRPDDSSFQENLNGVFDFLAANDSIDFIFLQEVDTFSRRSYYTNQTRLLTQALHSHNAAFALNYSAWVPLPITRPMAGVESGQMTFSRFVPDTALRYAYPLSYPWPVKLFQLDRCFILHRFGLQNGNELVLINTHNSAFGDAGNMRLYEMWMLRGFILDEFSRGNYVVVGGDWNMNPPGYSRSFYYSGYFKNYNTPVIDEDFIPEGWKWCYDPHLPTNRDVDQAYQHGYTPTTTYDFFLVSPNVRVDRVQVIDLGFRVSDHQPVYMHITLNPDPLSGCSPTAGNIIREISDSLRRFKSGELKVRKK